MVTRIINKAEKNILLVPTSECLFTSTSLTAKNKSDMLAALPFALEDELTEPVETLHFVLGEKQENNNYPVVVTKKKNIIDWLKEAKDKIDSMLPEVLALPWKENTWSIVVNNDNALVRHGKNQGFQCNVSQLKTQLGFLRRQTNKPELLNVWLPASMKTFDLPRDCANKIQGYHYQSSFEEWIKRSANPTDSINLFQGYLTKSDSSLTSVKPWLPATLVLVLALVFHNVSTWYQAYQTNNRISEMNQEIQEIFRQTFPGTQRVVNPRVQTQQKINELRNQLGNTSQINFLYIFDEIMTEIKNHKEITVKGFSWKQGLLQLQLVAKSVVQFEGLENSLQDKNYTVDVVNVVKKDKEFHAQLKVTREAQ